MDIVNDGTKTLDKHKGIVSPNETIRALIMQDFACAI